MPLGDYKECDICKENTFCDSFVNYRLDKDGEMRPMRVGDWKVLCKDCAKNFEVIVIKRED